MICSVNKKKNQNSSDNNSALSLQTLLRSVLLTPWDFSELEQSEHQLQALVTLTQRQVDIGADSAQGLQQW